MRPSRWILAIVALLFGVFAACTLGACGGESEAPITGVRGVNQQLAQLLKADGYQPVAAVSATKPKKNSTATVYVVCKQNDTLNDCAKARHHRATMSHPNIYAVGDKVIELEGPKLAHAGGRFLFMNVPSSWWDFTKLSTDQRKKLLGVMPTLTHDVGSSLNYADSDEPATIELADLGTVYAYAYDGDF